MPHENNKPAKSCFRDATAAHDAETVRLVREWADSQGTLGQIFGDLIDRFDMREVRGMQGMRERCAHEVFAILNRKPAAKKGKK